MADNDSLEYTQADNFTVEKANRKMIVVGNGTQLTNLTNTYPGQIIFCTVAGGAFAADTYYKRNAADSAWSTGIKIDEATESAELTNTPVTDNSQSGQNNRFYNFITMPSTTEFYVVTKMEWKNGDTASGTVVMGIDLVNANPPTINGSVLLGHTGPIAQSGADSVQSTTNFQCKPIRAGSVIGLWVSVTGGGNRRIKSSTGELEKGTTYSATPPSQDTSAFTNTFNASVYAKIYYRGYTPP